MNSGGTRKRKRGWGKQNQEGGRGKREDRKNRDGGKRKQREKKERKGSGEKERQGGDIERG